MDNSNLEDLLKNIDDRQFWLKPWGNPDRTPEEEERFFTSSAMTIGFSKQPNAVQLGDILVVHRIKVSKVMLIAEVISSPRQATEDEIRKNPLLERWSWGVEGKNLTPTYGAQWFEHSLKTFALVNEFKEQNPHEQFTIGSINFGSDKVRIPRSFGEYIIKKIQHLVEIPLLINL